MGSVRLNSAMMKKQENGLPNEVADYYTPLKGQLTALPELQKYQPHQSSVILNMLKPQAEEIMDEEQTGFRAGS